MGSTVARVMEAARELAKLQRASISVFRLGTLVGAAATPPAGSKIITTIDPTESA